LRAGPEGSAPLLPLETYFVYVISNKSRRLYVGITSQLELRVFQHKHKLFDNSFTSRYCFDMLVYFESFSDVYRALDREKELKGWRREKKLRLILVSNPNWADLSAEWREHESWKTLPDATYRPELQHRSSFS
jgi:putative endonuclease